MGEESHDGGDVSILGGVEMVREKQIPQDMISSMMN